MQENLIFKLITTSICIQVTLNYTFLQQHHWKTSNTNTWRKIRRKTRKCTEWSSKRPFKSSMHIFLMPKFLLQLINLQFTHNNNKLNTNYRFSAKLNNSRIKCVHTHLVTMPSSSPWLLFVYLSVFCQYSFSCSLAFPLSPSNKKTNSASTKKDYRCNGKSIKHKHPDKKEEKSKQQYETDVDKYQIKNSHFFISH